MGSLEISAYYVTSYYLIAAQMTNQNMFIEIIHLTSRQ